MIQISFNTQVNLQSFKRLDVITIVTIISGINHGNLLAIWVFFTVTLTDFDVSGEVSWKIMRERKENKLRRHYVISTS